MSVNYMREYFSEMSGISDEKNARAKRRAHLLSERDDRLIAFMRQNRPIAAISELEGLAHDYCLKTCRKLATQHNIDYQPVEEGFIEGITPASLRFRSHLGDYVHEMLETKHIHPLEIASRIGVLQVAQKRARERPFNHNWTLAQMERLAVDRGEDFTSLMLSALLTPIQFARVAACLNL